MALPNITHTVSLGEEDGIKEFYDIHIDANYSELTEAVKEYIEADCHAVVMDEEVVYNIYSTNNLSYRQRILEYTVRSQLMEDPHRHLFCPLLRQNKDFCIEIFMFQTNPWKIVIQFNCQTGQFSVTKKI